MRTSSVLLLAGLWWIISNGSVQSWMIGLPALVAASWATTRLSGSSVPRISLLGAFRFIPYFVWESLRGGLDVALRTLAPKMRVAPGFLRYRSELQSTSARTLFAYCICLLPGTLAADLQGEWLEIHTLATGSESRNELAKLERFIAGLFVEPETVP